MSIKPSSKGVVAVDVSIVLLNPCLLYTSGRLLRRMESYVSQTDAYHLYKSESGQVHTCHQITAGRDQRSQTADYRPSVLV